MEPEMSNIQTQLFNLLRVLQSSAHLSGLHSCLRCWSGFLGCSQPFGWFGVWEVLWLQHSWGCFPCSGWVLRQLLASVLCGLLGMCWSSWPESPGVMWVRSRAGVWPSRGRLKYTVGPFLFSRVHFPGFWWGKHDPTHDLFGAPQGDTNSSLVFLCGWPIYGCMICSAGKAFAAHKHNIFSFLASSFFQIQQG